MKKAWTFQRKGVKGWWVGWYEGGKRKSKAFPNKTLASHFQQIKYTQLNSDIFTGTINIDWLQMLEQYEHNKRVAGFQDSSIYEALLTLKHFARIAGPLSSGQIVQAAIDRFILQRQKEVKRFTVNKDINNLRAFLRWAEKCHYILSGLELRKLKTGPYSPNALLAPQIDKLLDAARQESDIWHMRVLLALSTGLRGNDIESLRISDINFETSTVRTQSKKTRKQMLERPLPAGLMPLLIDYVNNLPSGQIKLLDDGGERYHVRRKAWERIRQKAELPTIRFKDLRATFSSELQKQGVSLAIAQTLLEHSSPAVTSQYYTSVDDALVSAVNRLPVKKWLTG